MTPSAPEGQALRDALASRLMDKSRAMSRFETRELLVEAAEAITAAQADLDTLRRQLAEVARENDHLRASLANSGSPCAYCNLPREDWPTCPSGFPGCARADDAMLCPHVGVELATSDERDALAEMAGEAMAQRVFIRALYEATAADLVRSERERATADSRTREAEARAERAEAHAARVAEHRAAEVAARRASDAEVVRLSKVIDRLSADLHAARTTLETTP